MLVPLLRFAEWVMGFTRSGTPGDLGFETRRALAGRWRAGLSARRTRCPPGTILNDPPSRYNQTSAPNGRVTPLPAPRAAIFTRVAIYNSISNDPQGIEAGVERQREDCHALADRLGWQVYDTYVDNDLSAWTGKRRPSYERMLADIRSGKIDAVIVWHEDRLTRLPRELEEFADACLKAGVHRLVSCYGDTDLSNADDMLTLRIKGAVAKNQSDAASRRLRRKHLELAQGASPMAGGAPTATRAPSTTPTARSSTATVPTRRSCRPRRRASARRPSGCWRVSR